MSICFEFRGGCVRMPWNHAGEMLDVLQGLGLEKRHPGIGPVCLIDQELDPDVADSIATLLRDALAEGKIGGKMVTKDALGRKFNSAERIVAAGGPLPLEPNERAWVQGIIDLCSRPG